MMNKGNDATLFESSNYSVMIDDTLTDLDRKVLTHLYMPIIGNDAVNIYSTFYTFIESGTRESKIQSHLKLLRMLSLKETTFIEERKKLEAIGLIRTYFKDNLYIYVLKNVLTPYEFFKSNELMFLLIEKLGKQTVDELSYDFLLRKLDPAKFEDITSSFDDVYVMKNENDAEMYSQYGVNTTNDGIEVKNESFNLNVFLIMVEADDTINKDIIESKKFLDTSLRYAFFYGLNEEALKDAISLSANIDKTLNYDMYALQVKRLYDNKGIKKVAVIKKPAVVEKQDGIIKILDSLSPNDVVKNKFSTSLTSSEIDMFDRLQASSGVSIGVINMLIIYVVESKNGEIPAYNYFLKILNTWIRAGVKTTQDAFDMVTKSKQSDKTSKYTTKRIKETPEWVKDYANKINNNEKNKQSEENLDHITAFFEDSIKKENN